jgi:hypothetical protein
MSIFWSEVWLLELDHRTLEVQGIERAPTTHLGVVVWGMERRGV